MDKPREWWIKFEGVNGEFDGAYAIDERPPSSHGDNIIRVIEYSAYESMKAEHEKFCADAQEKTDRDFALVIAANDKLTKERDEYLKQLQDNEWKVEAQLRKELDEARAREKHWHEYSLKAFKVAQEADAKAQKLVEALKRWLDHENALEGDFDRLEEALAEFEKKK